MEDSFTAVGRGIARALAFVAIAALVVNVDSVRAQGEFVTPGPNTNVVGITPNLLHVPDFQLKQQQEPSCIMRPGNESYLFCAYNDLRASDLPLIQGDSWMGVSMSNDGGETWFSRLAPGYLGHPNSLGQGFAADPSVVAIPGNSPGLAILNYIAGNRGSSTGLLLAQRWVEFPQEDQEFWKAEDSIVVIADGSEGRFIDKPAFYYLVDPVSQQGAITEQILVENELAPITVTTPTGVLIAVYAVFTGNSGGSKVLMRKSFDNGLTWTQSQKISEEQNEVTGVSVTSLGNEFVIVYRRRGDNNEPDAIMSSHCTFTGNQKCTKGEVMFEMCPFDQPASGSTHRTFSFPWAANDGERYWAFAADRRFANDSSCTPVPGSPGLYSGKPRIVAMSSRNGKDWVGAAGNESQPIVVAPRAEGFQVIPVAFGTKGRIDVAWYDTFREEQVGLPAGNSDLLINDYTSGLARVFRKADVWMTRLTASCGNNANAGCTPSIASPVRVSRYPVALETLQADVQQEVKAHLPNLRMYASGTLAFNGDYISLATPPFRRLANGKWIPNSLPGGAAGTELPGYTDRQNLYVAWGDNRDVDADFTGPNSQVQLPYTPPLNSDANPGGPVVRAEEATDWEPYRDFGEMVAVDEPDDDPTLPSDLFSCSPGTFDFSHSRDSNVYGSLVQDTPTLLAPTPTKPLGTIQRMFPIEITNIDPVLSQDYCLQIANQPSDFAAGAGIASFYQLPAVAPFADGDQVELLDVAVPGGSSASRAVFVTTADATTVINVNAYEGTCPATPAGPFGTLINAVQLSDGPLFDPEFCSTNACDPVANNETHDISLASPVLQAPVLQAPSFQAPVLQAPVLQAPVLQAPSFQAPAFQAPSLQAPVLQAPVLQAPSLQAPVLQAPSLQAPSLQAGTPMGDADQQDLSVQDITYVVSTDANVTTTYSADIALAGLDPSEAIVQLIAWTPNIYTTTTDCFAAPIADQQIIAYTELDAPSLQAVNLPSTFTPTNQDPYVGELSFTGSSGQDIALTIRIWATGNARQTLLDLDAELQACLADESCDPEAQNLGAQKLISFGASAHACSTSDAADNTTTPGLPDCLNNGFEKIFVDRSPPVFNVAPNTVFSFEADDPGGAVVDLAGGPVTASDNGVPVPVVCYEVDSSGTILNVLPELLPVGNNLVRCEAVDIAGNVGSVPLFADVIDTIPPVVTLLGDPNPVIDAGTPYVDPGATATDLRGATVINLAVTVTGFVDSGTPGVYVLTYSATDGGGNLATATRTVTVLDVTPPVVSPAPDIPGVEATGSAGAVVNFVNPAAVDAVDGPVPTVCVPPSGSTFAIGATLVTCSATDAAGNTASTSFTVTVVDTTAPVVDTLPDLAVEATGPSGGVATWTNPAANDVVDGPLASSCVPASGSTFALGGPHVVTCSATDSAGNTGSSTFNVTVGDTTAPLVSADDIDIPVFTAVVDVQVDFASEVTATDAVDGDLLPSCTILNPGPGIVVNGNVAEISDYGTWTASCSATDSSGNTGSATFSISVNFPFGIQLTLPKGNINAGSTVPIDWEYTDLATGIVVDSGFVTPAISWVGPYASNDSTCSGATSGMGSGEDSGSSAMRYSASQRKWQFSWQTPNLPGRYLLVIAPPGAADADATACVRLR